MKPIIQPAQVPMTHVNFKRKKKLSSHSQQYKTKRRKQKTKETKGKKKKKRKGSERRDREIERRDKVEIESTRRDGDPPTHAVTPPPTPAPCHRDACELRDPSRTSTAFRSRTSMAPPNYISKIENFSKKN